ncbi:Peptidoglycan/xylan/chitin deacetylase, PgdA/CDA1 family [Actinomadura meyerae]|uniref:Peptidoglycan/xylan/chitin deacetylase, PgdA/CDA1 family n=1 Tax=Actinomadura meyerae TaxID=240840 RepID=A0A239FBJ8_9ACTN|nr:polysaccharide deacetylase family protein [Actinomadura meyerae]SNS53683.1 Peptidoglycan/xylan/chitin deacetylase, PgdA/CDA1 family [Actinomadura meyerae]
MRALRAVVGAAVLVALLGARGCEASEGDGAAPAPVEREPVPTATPVVRDEAAEWAKWGLKPLPPAPPPPEEKPLELGGKGPVEVFDKVPTEQRVVFITIDDGQEKDPRFVQMLTDLQVPVTMFLTDNVIQDDYGYFKPLQALGNRVQNHTLTHPVLPVLGLDGQKREICGNQKVLSKQYGTEPTLLRPPYGRWNWATQQAARECGIDGIVMWRASMQIHDMQYDDANKKLHPGDILLAHFRGPEQLKGATMTEMFAAMLKRIGKQGFAVARLEDYVTPR